MEGMVTEYLVATFADYFADVKMLILKTHAKDFSMLPRKLFFKLSVLFLKTQVCRIYL